MSIVLDAQVAALLARLESQRDRACREVLAHAQAEAQQLLREARHRGRSQLRGAVLAKRARVAEHCRRTRLELEAEQRSQEFSQLRCDLDAGLAQLPAALAARWREAASRREWCEALLSQAHGLLGGTGWCIEHAPGLGGDELAWLAARVRELAGADARLALDRSLDAGLRVRRGGTCLDGTPAGLTSDRARVEAALLDELAGGAA